MPMQKSTPAANLATLVLVEGSPLARATVVALVAEAAALNASLGDPTTLPTKT